MRRSYGVVAVIFASTHVALWACSAASQPVDSSSGDAAQTDAADDFHSDPSRVEPPPEVCNATVQQGSVVAEIAIGSAPPMPGGGTIEPGTYVLTATESFTGPGGPSGLTGKIGKTTVVVSATRFESNLAQGTVDSGLRAARTLIDEYVTRDGSFFISEKCPRGPGYGVRLDYTVGDGGFSLLLNEEEARTLSTFTRVP